MLAQIFRRVGYSWEGDGCLFHGAKFALVAALIAAAALTPTPPEPKPQPTEQDIQDWLNSA